MRCARTSVSVFVGCGRERIREVDGLYGLDGEEFVGEDKSAI